MGKYYCLIAGLPTIQLDDSKLNYSLISFRETLDGILTSADKQWVDLFFLKFDNKNLLAYLKNSEQMLDPRGSISSESFEIAIKAIKEEEQVPKQAGLPSYMVTFIKHYIDQDGEQTIPWEDQLAAYYYEYAMQAKNTFVANWFELNLNINNLLTVLTCRKHGLDKSAYIVGDNEVAEALRTSSARDFGLADLVDYLPELMRIADETDLMAREKKVDLLKWNWLDNGTFFKPFDIENIMAYLLKIEMIERWVTLDPVSGEKTFREIVGAMKKGSVNALEEFKRNN